MPQHASDPLLTAGKIMTNILRALLAVIAIGILIAIPAIILSKSHVAEALADNADSLALVLSAITLVLLLCLAVVAGAFLFFRHLGQMIDTVREGDPFQIANADRLEKMGWIAVAFQIAAIPMMAGAAYLRTQFPADDFRFDVELSLTGILLAIVLFILARVFRHGAAMRDDLEGTV